MCKKMYVNAIGDIKTDTDHCFALSFLFFLFFFVILFDMWIVVQNQLCFFFLISQVAECLVMLFFPSISFFQEI